jgi:protocatechuate 3,4-dioxygenase beta subunit
LTHRASIKDALLARRRILEGAGLAVTLAPLLKLAGCAASSQAGVGAAGSGAGAGSNETSAGAGGAGDGSTGNYANGGTDAITDPTSYPDPFASGGTSCELHCETTIGPCHTSSVEREDLSDGWNGLPMRVELRVVDRDCNPVESAIVELWHTNHLGVYSGRINTMCNEAESDRAAAYFRGYQRTDAEGRVAFNTCFPGWYSGRAVHIHVRVQTGEYDAADSATAWVITQLLFADELVLSVFGSEPLYSDQGQPDTWLGDDNVIGGESDPSPYLFDVAKMDDGVMQASKTLVIRSALTDAACSVAGASGGMGGPP